MSVAAFRPLAMARTTRLAPLAASPATNTFSANWGCSGFRNPIARRTRSASITSTFPVGFMTGRPPSGPGIHSTCSTSTPQTLPFCRETYEWRETTGGCILLRGKRWFSAQGGIGAMEWLDLSYGRLGHDFDLGDACSTLTVTGSDAVAAGVTSADD